MIHFDMPFWFILVISSILTTIVCILAFRSAARQGAVALGFLMISLTTWSLFYAVELGSTDLEHMLFLAKIEYIGIVTLPPAWLIFALSLNPWKKLKSRRFNISLFVIPAMILLFCWTNDWHHSFWLSNNLVVIDGRNVMINAFGPVFWVHLAYSYLLIVGGTGLLLYRFIVTDAIYRYRFFYILIPIFPLAANVAQFANLNPFGYLDLTPFAFSISGLMLLWGSTKSFRMEFIPISREVLMENLEEGIIIANHTGEIVDTNGAALRITGFHTNRQLQTYLSENFTDMLVSGEHKQMELNHRLNRPHVLMKTTPVLSGNKLAGRLITLIDITAEKEFALALQESKERYEAIFARLHDALLVESLTGEILDANQAACRMYGLTREEMLTKTAHDLAGNYPTLSVNPESYAKRIFPVLQETVLQSRHMRSNGVVFPVEVSSNILSLTGTDVLLVIIRNITEKVQAEATIRSRERYLQLLNKITWDALAGNSLNETLQALVERLAELFGASSAFINLWDEQTLRIQPGAACGSMKKIYPKLNAQSVENTITKDALDRLQPIIVEDIYKAAYQSPEISLLYPSRTVMALPLVAGTQKLGCALVAFDDLHLFTEEDMRWGKQVADQIALSISRSYLMQKTQDLLSESQKMNETLEQMNETLEHRISIRTEELNTAYNATIEGWARALELREKETAGHSQRTVNMSLRFAKKLNVAGEQLEHIRRGSLLHDIGKMVISDAILQKPGALTAAERKIIEEHPVYSRKILEPIAYLHMATDIPFYHHERWDGTGYPEGLAGEAIPRDARMFAIVDVWDALSSSRYYRDALPKEKVIEHIKKGVGTHFDPVMAKVFLQMIQDDPDDPVT